MTQRYGKIFHLHSWVELAIPCQPCFSSISIILALAGSHVGVQTIHTTIPATVLRMRSSDTLRHGADTPSSLFALSGQRQPLHLQGRQRKTSQKKKALRTSFLGKYSGRFISCYFLADLGICARRASEVSNSCNQYGGPEEVSTSAKS